ncbi:MAG: hypothetical protein EXR97_03035 [Nitrospiraceae bacterium]|nr:hypothetical protein [Nitrospiraceae bacterium]MSR24814.1 hypothetical protein [Nitrospiraceae bacterium]
MKILRNQRGAIGTVGDVLILLLVLITIGAWWITQRNKPRVLPPPVPAGPVASAPLPIVTPSQTAPAPSLVASPPLLQGGQLRPFTPGSLPSSQYATAIETIHALIEQGRDGDAEARLAALPREALSDEQIRQAAAVL